MKKVFSVLLALIVPLIACSSSNLESKASTVNASTSAKESKTSSYSSSNYRSVAYFTSWSAYDRNVTFENVDPNLLTHINFAFANLNTDGEIVVGDRWIDTEKVFNSSGTNSLNGLYGQLNDLKKRYPHIKTLISVGGWTWSTNFSAVASTELGREKFAQSAVNFITKYGFDGIDIDWEFPVEGGNNIPHNPNDKVTYTKLVQKTREALDRQGAIDNKHYLLTIAGGPNPSFAQNTQLSEMSRYLDFINIMAYDYHGAWEGTTNHNAPLYSNGNNLSVSKTVDAYINAGVDPKSLNLGLAFYGRGWNNVTSLSNNGLNQTGSAPTSVGYGQGTWEASSFDYWDIKDNYINKNGYKRYFDDVAKVPYLFNGSVFISYDDEESITAKLDFAKEKGLGGVMFWEFSGDKNKTLQTVISDFYKNTPSSNIQSVSSADSNSEAISTESPSNNENSAGSNSANSWNKDSIYVKGDTVLYNEKTFRAKWWTQGESPNIEDEWGPWELVK